MEEFSELKSARLLSIYARLLNGRVLKKTDLAQEFGVMSIPNVVILKDGQLADRKVGAMPVKAYQDALDAALN